MHNPIVMPPGVKTATTRGEFRDGVEVMRSARTWDLNCGHEAKRGDKFLIGPIAGPTACLGCGPSLVRRMLADVLAGRRYPPRPDRNPFPRMRIL